MYTDTSLAIVLVFATVVLNPVWKSDAGQVVTGSIFAGASPSLFIVLTMSSILAWANNAADKLPAVPLVTCVFVLPEDLVIAVPCKILARIFFNRFNAATVCNFSPVPYCDVDPTK